MLPDDDDLADVREWQVRHVFRSIELFNADFCLPVRYYRCQRTHPPSCFFCVHILFDIADYCWCISSCNAEFTAVPFDHTRFSEGGAAAARGAQAAQRQCAVNGLCSVSVM
jgi:hypothetical protein